MHMNKMDDNSATNSSWFGMKLFFIGLLLPAPALLVRIVFDVENNIVVTLSVFLFISGFVMAGIGMVFHWKSFAIPLKHSTKENKEIEQINTIKQPWE